jgi:beta-lactamase regulating signal transducer with metallopeptidase domain
MNAVPNSEPLLQTGWFLQSLAVGALGAACVALCPPAWRGRVRQWVPVAAFIALVLLVASPLWPDAVRPKIDASEALANVVAADLWKWVPWVWATGCVLFLLRVAAGTWTVWRIVRSTQPVPGRAWKQVLADCQRTLGLRGRVRLRLAGPGFVPSAAGLLRRTVLLPDEALHWTSEQRRLVLLHELGHFRRGDLWTHALGRVVCALHWFNPFAWLLHRQLAVEREFACDALVLERGAPPDDYATLLFEMATASRRRPAMQAAFLTMASRRTGKLEARVRRILAPGRRAGRWLRLADGVLCTALAVALVALVACKPVRHVLRASDWTPAEIGLRENAQPFSDLAL